MTSPTKRHRGPTKGSKNSRLKRTALHKAIGAEVRRQREGREMDHKEFGKLVGISQGMVSQLETGARFPSLRTLWRIAQRCGIPIAYFFQGLNDG